MNQAKQNKDVNLAIETSGRVGRIAVGRGDELLATRELPQKRRHNIDLIQTIDEVFAELGIEKDELGEVYVSTGPGSFTGLRIGITTAKVMSMATGVKIVEVPTLQAVAQNGVGEGIRRVGACLNMKRGTVYCGVYEVSEGETGTGMRILNELAKPRLRTMEELVELGGEEMVVVGEPLPDWEEFKGKVRGVTGEEASSKAEVVWHLGREKAKRGEFIEGNQLKAAYIREPEAVTLWNMKHGPEK